jgi:hypothetical protein
MPTRHRFDPEDVLIAWEVFRNGPSYGLVTSAFRSIGAEYLEGRVGFEPTTPGLKVRDPIAQPTARGTQPRADHRAVLGSALRFIGHDLSTRYVESKSRSWESGTRTSFEQRLRKCTIDNGDLNLASSRPPQRGAVNDWRARARPGSLQVSSGLDWSRLTTSST